MRRRQDSQLRRTGETRLAHLALAELGHDVDLLVERLLHRRQLLPLVGESVLNLLDRLSHSVRVVGARLDLLLQLVQFRLGGLDGRGARLDRLGELLDILLRLGLADFGLGETVGAEVDLRLEVLHLGLLAAELDSSDLENLLLVELDLVVDGRGLLL